MLFKPQPRELHWKAAGVYLTLIPLSQDVDQKFIEETTTQLLDEKGRLTGYKRDTAKYAQLVGRECIKGWRGPKDNNKKPVECTPEAIDAFMLIEPAQDFVIEKVKGLELYLAEELDEAKNA